MKRGGFAYSSVYWLVNGENKWESAKGRKAHNNEDDADVGGV